MSSVTIKPFDISIMDIEGDGLYDTVTTVWCGTLICCTTGQVKSFRPNQMKEFLDALASVQLAIGHNVLDFDYPALRKVFGFAYKDSDLFDTLVLSRLLYPDLLGGHSLGAWGNRLGEPKGDFNEWHRFSEEMLTYNVQDCRVNLKLLIRLMKYCGWTWQDLLDIQRAKIHWKEG